MVFRFAGMMFAVWMLGARCVSAAEPVTPANSGKAPLAVNDAAEPPFDLTDPARIEAGQRRFSANCAAYCHGFEGSGGKTPAFRGRKDLKQQEVFKVITEGRTGSDVMPAWGNGFSVEKRWELVAYIMHLTRQPPAGTEPR